MTEPDLVVIGAGPAGMAAARLAAEHGADVLLLDEQAAPGGQIYRAVTAGGMERAAILGADYAAGRALAEALDHPGITHLTGATVWRVEREGRVVWSRGGRAASTGAPRVLVATGAVERAVPVPGWTLPGVMTAGAGQILLKTAGLLPDRTVLAGSGPLLYLLAAQMAAAGRPPVALVETQGAADHLRAARHLPRALAGWRLLAKGAKMLAAIRRAGIPRETGARALRVLGEDRATGLAFTAGGRRREIACDTVLLHQGVVPNVQITRALGLDHDWDPLQRCWRVRRDGWGATGAEAILVAGDGAGIAGAGAAALTGRLASLAALTDLGRIDADQRDRLAAPVRAELARETAARPLIDTLYAPPAEVLTPPDEAVVCRCEDVTAGAIRRYAALGCTGPNQAKAFGRSGMGPCQGRYCGLTVAEILAAEQGVGPESVGYYRIRSPLKPVTLGELASLAPEEEPVP